MKREDSKEKLVVLGVGVEGADAVKRMIDTNIEGVDFLIVNADEEFSRDTLCDTDLLFIVDIFGQEKDLAVSIARTAKSVGALTLGIPLTCKGIDEKDMQNFKDASDAVIMYNAEENNPDILHDIIRGITDIIVKEGFVNLDFFDIKTILHNVGTAFVEIGRAEGKNKVRNAALQAANMCCNIHNAKSILLNVTTDEDISIAETADAAKIAEDTADYEASVIWGHVIDENMHDAVNIIFLAALNDNGYRTYKEMFEEESPENIAALVKNGLSENQILRLGSALEFFKAALQYGTLEIIRLFIVKGYDPKSLEVDGVFPNEILEDISGRDNCLEIYSLLFDAKITLSGSFNCLIPLILRRNSKILQAFINYGWDVNSHDESCFTSLMAVLRDLKRPLDSVKLLINAGADVNARDLYGRTPLMFITRCCNEPLECLKLLVDNGADVNAADENEFNTFMHAAEWASSSPEAVKIFLDVGIDINARNSYGFTVLEMMSEFVNNRNDLTNEQKKCFHFQVMPLMIRAGADSSRFETCCSSDAHTAYRPQRMSPTLYDRYRKRILQQKYDALRDLNPVSMKYETQDFLEKVFRQAICDYDADLVKKLLEEVPLEFLALQSLKYDVSMSFRTNIFPEAESDSSAETQEIKNKLDAGAKILRLLRNAGVDVPMIAPTGSELTYVISASCINLTLFADITGERISDTGFDALCCAYSPKAVEQVIMSGVDVNTKCYRHQSALKAIVENFRDYYDPAGIVRILLSNHADIAPLFNTWLRKYFLSAKERLSLADPAQIAILDEVRPYYRDYRIDLQALKLEYKNA